MKNKTKRTVILGVICALLAAAASWYTITFNDQRFIAPMDLSEYVFRVQDLPMIISGILITLYVLYLFALLVKAIAVKKEKERTSQFARAVDPRLGFLGFWTYSIDKTIFPFTFFMFFGFFGFFYEGKMSHTFMDERYRENKLKAHMTANKTAFAIIFFALLILGQGKLMGNLEYTLIALIIVIALSIALEIFLGEYLLYCYDNDEQFEESGE